MTDMRRQKSMFNLRPDLVKTVVESLEKEGCNLGNITAACGWTDLSGNRYQPETGFIIWILETGLIFLKQMIFMNTVISRETGLNHIILFIETGMTFVETSEISFGI